MARRLTYDKQQITLPGFTLTPHGLQIDDGVTESQWENCGEVLDTMSKATQWAIGDWYLHGEQEWGRKYDDCQERFGIEYQTVANLVSVARKFEFSRRRENLTWSHHEEVAGLDPFEADLLLDEAEEQEWTRKQIRAARRQSNFPEPVSPPDGEYSTVVMDPPWPMEKVERDERPIAIGVLRIKAKMGELMPRGKGGRGKKTPDPGLGVSDKAIAAYRKLSDHSERLEDYFDSSEDVPSQADFLKWVSGTPHVTNNSGNNEWYTPAEYVESVRKVLGAIDLDPTSCEVAQATVRASQFYTIDDDGLDREWQGKKHPVVAGPSDTVSLESGSDTTCDKG